MAILHDKQSEFIQSTKRYKLLNWGRRSGKTFAVGYDIYPDLWNIDDCRVAYYAPNRDDARDIAWDAFKQLCEPITEHINETLLEITVRNQHFGKEGHKGTSLLKLYGWEAVKNSDKGRGVENDVVVLDEAAFYPMFKEKYEKVIEPTLLTSKGRLVVTSTPNGFNHFYEMADWAMKNDDWFFSHATSYDNPFNDPEDLDKLKAEKPADSFAQEYLADFRKVEGLVYDEYDHKRHRLTEMPMHFINPNERMPYFKPGYQEATSLESRGCVDWGFTNPSAMYTVHKSNKGIYYITDEYYEAGKVQEELIDIMSSRQLDGWYPDPAEPDRLEMMRRAGLTVKEVSKDIVAGINTVQSLLKQNRLFIVNCPNLESEINFYRWREKPNSAIDDSMPELPVKGNDHGLDAIRYCLHMWENTEAGNLDRTVHRINSQIFGEGGGSAWD